LASKVVGIFSRNDRGAINSEPINKKERLKMNGLILCNEDKDFSLWGEVS